MRRITLILIVFISLGLVSAGALAEIYALNFKSGSAAINENGEVLISPGIYEKLFVLENDSGEHTGYAAGIKKNGIIKYCLLDTQGNQKTEFRYSEILSAGDGYIVCEDGKYKYITNGAIYDNYEFDGLKYIGGGRVLAVRGNVYDDIGDALTVLWPEGLSFNTGIKTLNGFGEYSEGYMPMYDDDTGLYGYIDTEASWAISPTFQYAGDFLNGLAVVSTANGYGVIDTEGRFVLSAGCPRILRNTHMFAVIRNDKLRVYDAELNETYIMPSEGADVKISGKYIVMIKDGGTAIYDVYGEKIFEVCCDASVIAAEDEIFIIRTGVWNEASAALYDIDGNILSDMYNTIYVLDSDVFAYGVLDANGNMIYGLLGKDGIPITEAVYDSMVFVMEGMYLADTETGAVLIDANGDIQCAFETGFQKTAGQRE